MKAYDVYEHPHFGRKVVKRGFIWPAFFFPLIWAWVKGMVMVGFAIFGAMFLVGGLTGILISGLDEQNAEGVLFLLAIVFSIFIGFNASKWRCNHLRKKGYKLVETVDPKNTIPTP